MLKRHETMLYKSVIDGFDRLFDRKSTSIDVATLLIAKKKELTGTRLDSEFESAIQHHRSSLDADLSPENQRDNALAITDRLRKLIAVELLDDSVKNPKRRLRPKKHQSYAISNCGIRT